MAAQLNFLRLLILLDGTKSKRKIYKKKFGCLF